VKAVSPEIIGSDCDPLHQLQSASIGIEPTENIEANAMKNILDHEAMLKLADSCKG
jgi:hypothetical protein